MRVFVRYSQAGAILGVCKADVIADGLEHPFGDVGANETVIEVPASDQLEGLEAHEIVAQYSVDPRAKKLRRRRR